MVARAKVRKVKWGIGSDEPDDLPDFLSNEEIVEKNGNELPRGIFQVQIKSIKVGENKNGDAMLKILAEILDQRKEKKGYNGYVFFENQNITEQGKPFLMRFLKAIGATWDDFINNTKDNGDDPEPTILSIGSVKWGDKAKKVMLRVSTKFDNYQGNERMVVGRWLPPEDSDASEELDDDADADEDDGIEVVDEDEELEDADEDGEEGDAEDLEEAEEELREELDELTLAALKTRAKGNAKEAGETLTVADLKGKDKSAMIDMIVEQELSGGADEEAEADEIDPEAEEELREELDELDMKGLRERLKTDHGWKFSQLKGKSEDELKDAIVELELSEPPF